VDLDQSTGSAEIRLAQMMLSGPLADEQFGVRWSCRNLIRYLARLSSVSVSKFAVSACAAVGVLAAACTSAAATHRLSTRDADPVSKTATTAATALVRSPVERKLWSIARSAARADGGTIARAEAVRSVHRRAVRVTMGDFVPGRQPVWVIQVEGTSEFVCQSCKGPATVDAPRGRFLIVVVGLKTFEGLDDSIGSKRANLARLGSVLQLHGS
jgi:hypothetical protein